MNRLLETLTRWIFDGVDDCDHDFSGRFGELPGECPKCGMARSWVSSAFNTGLFPRLQDPLLQRPPRGAA